MCKVVIYQIQSYIHKETRGPVLARHLRTHENQQYKGLFQYNIGGWVKLHSVETDENYWRSNLNQDITIINKEIEEQADSLKTIISEVTKLNELAEAGYSIESTSEFATKDNVEGVCALLRRLSQYNNRNTKVHILSAGSTNKRLNYIMSPCKSRSSRGEAPIVLEGH